MSELSPEARALLRAARTARETPPDAADRVRASVDQTLALVAAGVHPPPPAPSVSLTAPGLFTAPKLVGLAAVALSLGAAALRPAAPPKPAAPVVSPAPHGASVARAPAPPAAPRAAPPVAPSVAPAAHLAPAARAARTPPVTAPVARRAPPVEPPSPAAPTSASLAGAPTPARTDDALHLADEVQRLRVAREALRNGSADAAIAALDDYAHAHPAGSLRDEGDVLRVRALCAAGRSSEARAVADAWLARTPRSPLTTTVRRSCAFDAP